MDMTIIRNAEIISDVADGINDILIAGGRIQEIGKHLEGYPGCIEVDAGGRLAVPGLVDGHVHLTGGGGEDGCLSRVPPLGEKKIVEAGVTSVVGLLGTEQLVERRTQTDDVGIVAREPPVCRAADAVDRPDGRSLERKFVCQRHHLALVGDRDIQSAQIGCAAQQFGQCID